MRSITSEFSEYVNSEYGVEVERMELGELRFTKIVWAAALHSLSKGKGLSRRGAHCTNGVEATVGERASFIRTQWPRGMPMMRSPSMESC